jgi:glycosyltransferase involved in cell wall biosynthesis
MIRILCIDIEGGHGGSSRSLYESVKYISKSKAKIEVWCKCYGNIQEKYKLINVPTKVCRDIPKATSVKLFSRNLLILLDFFIFRWPKSKKFRKSLRDASCRFDMIHLNHESLYWLARWICRNTDIVVTMHKRTMLVDTVFSRFQVGVIGKYVSNLVYITENEKDNFIKLGGKNKFGKVINNIVGIEKIKCKPHKKILIKKGFKLCTLANYSYNRGLDRLINIAEELKKLGRTDIVFIVAGDMSLPRSLPGHLGRISKNHGNLSDYAVLKGVIDMFLFLGHVSKPERVLSGCDVLIRPSRENNPWGRDILEAFSYGIPVVSFGNYNRFVENNVTGVILNDFNPKTVALKIVELLDNKEQTKIMGLNGKKRVENLCNTIDRSNDLVSLWEETLIQVQT